MEIAAGLTIAAILACFGIGVSIKKIRKNSQERDGLLLIAICCFVLAGVSLVNLAAYL